MENQHKKITGYRDLTQEEIDLMNKIKEKANEVGELVDMLEGMNFDKNDYVPKNESWRWVAIGKTHLQQGFMALTRAVAKPKFF